MPHIPTRPTMFVVSPLLIEIEKRNFVKLTLNEIYRIRAKARELVKLGETEWPEIVLNRDDDTPLRLDIKGLKLAEVCQLKPNDLVGHTEQTFYACFSWFGRRDPVRSAIFWFPSKSSRDAFVKAYDPYAWAVEKKSLPAWKLREAVKGF